MLGLSLPAGMAAREFTVTVEERTEVLRLEPGERTRLIVPVEAGEGSIPPLEVQAGGAEIRDGATANPRIVSARVTELRFEPGAPGVSS